jgi:hypothetical protein
VAKRIRAIEDPKCEALFSETEWPNRAKPLTARDAHKLVMSSKEIEPNMETATIDSDAPNLEYARRDKAAHRCTFCTTENAAPRRATRLIDTEDPM